MRRRNIIAVCCSCAFSERKRVNFEQIFRFPIWKNVIIYAKAHLCCVKIFENSY